MPGDNQNENRIAKHHSSASTIFNSDDFLLKEFDAAKFVANAQANATLNVLHNKLVDHIAALKQDLYNLINRDYEDFILVNKKLAGVDDKVNDILTPIQYLFNQIKDLRENLSSRINRLQSLLDERAEINSRKNALERCLRFISSLEDAERLLGISVRAASNDLTNQYSDFNELSWSDDEENDPALELVTAEFRSSASKSDICSDIERASHSLLALKSDESLITQDPKTSCASEISNRTSRVEAELIKKLKDYFIELITPSISTSSIDESSIASCLRSFALLRCGKDAEAIFTRTVLHPFFDGNLTQGRLDSGSRGSCQGLSMIYDDLIEYISLHCAPIVKCNINTFLSSSNPPIDLLYNGVWKAVHTSILARVPSLFATGLADIFHRNYCLSQTFMHRLVEVCHGNEISLRNHPTTATFQSQWNLPIYFQLRQREITNVLDEALGLHTPKASLYLVRCGEYFLAESQAIWDALIRCWHIEVYLEPLAHRHLRLTLQVLSRFSNWANEKMSEKDITAENCAAISSDFSTLSLKFSSDGEFCIILRKILTMDEMFEITKDAVIDATRSWGMHAEKAWTAASNMISAECCALLQAVRGVTATYRMTNRPPPERPSVFVHSMLKPLQDFDKEWGKLSPKSMIHWKRGVINTVCESYLEALKELLATARQMDESLRKRRSRRVLVNDGGMSDTEKIVLQLQFDVNAFAQEISLLGIDAMSVDSYQLMLTEVRQISGESADIYSTRSDKF